MIAVAAAFVIIVIRQTNLIIFDSIFAQMAFMNIADQVIFIPTTLDAITMMILQAVIV
jgi:hypothetical protein